MSNRWDRLGWLESRGYLHRKALFLDLNFWIRLSEPHNSSQEQLGKLLSDLVEAEQLICPVSVSLLMEVAKRPREVRRESYTQLMDKLSNGLTLRMVQDTFRDEFQASLEGRQSERQMAYSHVIDASWGGLTLPLSEGAAGNEIRRFLSTVVAKTLFNSLSAMSITDFMNEWMEGATETGVANLRQGFSERSRQEGEWRQQNPVTPQAVKHAEFDGTFQALRPTMLRAISITYPDGAPDWTRDELVRLLDSCPSFWCSYKMMSAVRLNRPKVTENDVWDFLNVAFAVPYVDCLACDNATRHICSNVLQVEKRYGSQIVSRDEDLVTWLKSLN